MVRKPVRGEMLRNCDDFAAVRQNICESLREAAFMRLTVRI